jgi:hypothetical protein
MVFITRRSLQALFLFAALMVAYPGAGSAAGTPTNIPLIGSTFSLQLPDGFHLIEQKAKEKRAWAHFASEDDAPRRLKQMLSVTQYKGALLGKPADQWQSIAQKRCLKSTSESCVNEPVSVGLFAAARVAGLDSWSGIFYCTQFRQPAAGSENGIVASTATWGGDDAFIALWDSEDLYVIRWWEIRKVVGTELPHRDDVWRKRMDGLFPLNVSR